MVDGTVDLGSSASARARPATGSGRTSATARSGTAATGTRGTPTVVDGGSFAGTRPGTARTPAPAPTVVRPQRIESRPRPAPAPSGGSPWLYVALGGLLVALLAAGGYIYLSKQKPEVAQVAPTPAPPTPTPAAVTAPTEAPPTPAPATAAPPPTFAEATGKGAAAMRAAQAAFKKGDYDKALKSAQGVLAEDETNKGAKDLVQRSLEGQKADERARRAQAALAKGDFPTAESEAAAAHELAPWDGRFTDLINRVRETQGSAQREAQAREQREAAAREQQQKQAATSKINEFLTKADDAMAKSQFEAAIQLYDEAVKLDPNNSRAASGKTSAIGARALAQAASAGGLRGAGKAFVSGKTQAQSAETKAGNAPPGFEESAGVDVKRGSAAAELPGKIQFEPRPEVVKAGDQYSVSIYLVNEGAGPIAVRAMAVSIVKNGTRAGGPVPPQTKDVAPRQKALLLATSTDMWKEDTASWQMEVTVTTVRGERYTNTLSWK
jgi:tetratricopeptide (TPR) repeat protein